MKITTATTKRTTTILTVIVLLVSAAGAQVRDKLEGKYKITGYSFSDKRTYPLEKMDITLNIDRDMKVGGRSACNLYSGTLVVGPGRTMKLGTMTTTEMACSELNGSFEGEFMNVLSKANRYELKGNTLTLTDTATGHYMRFENMSGTTEPPAGSDETEHEVFYIANRTAKCAAISPQRCLLIKKERDGTWEKYYDSIIGFTPKAGRFYKIEVERAGDPPSGLPGDVTIYRHKLVHILRSSTREKDIYR